MLKVFSLVVSALIVVGIAILVAGYMSSPIYSSEEIFEVPYSQDLVWKEFLNVERTNLKKGDVESVDIVDKYGNLFAWKENLKNGGYRIYRLNQRVEERKAVFELIESTYGLTGTWTFDFEKSDYGTLIQIKEESTLTDAKIRGYRYFFGKNHDMLVWKKYIRVGQTIQLLKTP